jgi:hypothetical protein
LSDSPRRRRRDLGQGLVEYGIVLVIALAVCAVVLVVFGDQLSFLLGQLTRAI